MRRRKVPTVWLMTDERGGDPVALARALPKGSGIVFRHRATPKRERRALFRRVRQVARQRRLVLLLAAPPSQAHAWGADGAHNRSALKSYGLRSVAAHNRCEMVIARRTKADIVVVSPVFRTRSHPGIVPLGVVRFGLLVGSQRQRAIALGGMNAARFGRLSGMKTHGWAAIDAFK